MSQENVEIVRRGYEHFNRSGEVDYSVLDPEIIYDLSRRTFDPLVFRGHEGVREFWRIIWEQWASRRMEPQDLIDAGDKVVASVRLVGVGRQSGVETMANAAHVWTFREGKIVRLTVFQTMQEAVEAVGLRESAMSQENVEIVRRSFAAWNAGDLARWGSMHHAEVVVVPPDGWPEGEPPRSRDEWLAQAGRLIDSWAEQRIEAVRIYDAGERVVGLFEWVTRGKGSHIDLVTKMALIATVQEGLITRAVYYNSHDEALEAVGLSE